MMSLNWLWGIVTRIGIGGKPSKERVLVLGCHDLNMFSPRGRADRNNNGGRLPPSHKTHLEKSKFQQDPFSP